MEWRHSQFRLKLAASAPTTVEVASHEPQSREKLIARKIIASGIQRSGVNRDWDWLWWQIIQTKWNMVEDNCDWNWCDGTNHSQDSLKRGGLVIKERPRMISEWKISAEVGYYRSGGWSTSEAEMIKSSLGR
jgi:hypothetical protein